MSLRAAVAPAASPVRRPESAMAARAARVWDTGLIAVFLGLTFLLGLFPLKDTDFWWHLKAGDLIRQTGWVPTVDTFTFGAEGHGWVDLHWVYQLLISWGFERFGVIGINVAKCTITALAVGLLVTSGRRGWPVWVTLLAWLPAVLVLSGRMYVRPETLTLLYLALDVAILARWDRRPWLAFALPVVQVLWVNTQGLFIFGPFLIVVALLDAATRRRSFAPERRGWWRTALIALAVTVLACLINPYGLRGATYPLELLGTMGNPIFKQTIAELKPLPTLFAEVGFDLLPLQIHLFTAALGVFSFVIPTTWRIVTALQDRRAARTAAPDRAETKPAKGTRKPRKSPKAGKRDEESGRPLPWFRLILFLTFSGLGVMASRNSHQFAAVVGTITAWNFAEWAAEISVRVRRRAVAPGSITQPVLAIWPRVATLGILILAIVAVGSGRFYVWSGEGRTVGWREEPLWFAHAAMKFAGSPGMPERNVSFHNGHAALFEYYWAPDKKVYTDARLEVMGSDLYQEYIDLQSKINFNTPGWSDDLDKLGHPSVLLDTVHLTSGSMVATMLNARRWHCVWFDPIAAVFVDDSYPRIVQAHEVDFLARHYANEAEANNPDRDTTSALARSLRTTASSLRGMAGGTTKAQSLIWLGLDYARRLRQLDPNDLDGYKQAGLLNYLRDLWSSEQPIPRFRLPFDPTIDLALVTSAYQLDRALAIDPAEGICLFTLANLDLMRGMDEAAISPLERFAQQPNKNLTQQAQKASVVHQVAEIRHRLGVEPPTSWANLSELEQVYDRLTRSGRAETAARVIEAAHRDGARPWVWADRLATLLLHLGQPARARSVWRTAVEGPPALQAARVAATYLIEDDLAAARTSYAAAIASDPALFEAHFGLARLEQGAGRAAEAVAAARAAEAVAPNDRSRNLARSIIKEASAYARRTPKGVQESP